MIFEKLCELVSEQFNVEVESLDTTTSFMQDLNADSLDFVELMMAIEEEFDIPEVDEKTLETVLTMGDAVDMIKEITGE